ncbi:bifunctional DNA primase/polymerase [Streptomyces sp. NPDC050560]|uniref:bifunctional DNA primase/polymerase n=1 Tax=Streptomyces sp. NPDC050560 TaxID=3365630 RepID=UPI0037A439F3
MAIIDRHAVPPAQRALDHALAAAERGLAVFPLSRAKLPALRSPHHDDPRPIRCRGACGRFGHGVYDASSDPGRVRALFSAAPRATGYGIACGVPPYHLIGIDIDAPGHDATAAGAESSVLRELALRHLFELGETVTVMTPRGGRHLWLSGPADTPVPNSAGRLAPGVDVRGAGGYLVGPGSLASGGVYGVVPGTDRLPPAPCPPGLLRLLAPRVPRHAAPAHGHRDGSGLVQFVLAAEEGQRNTRLFWAACRAYENGLGDLLGPALISAAQHTGLTEHEARATLASAWRLSGG